MSHVFVVLAAILANYAVNAASFAVFRKWNPALWLVSVSVCFAGAWLVW